ncbi:MAG: hypothetical protein R3181_07010 [Rubricoccaceae bacterium]|nr:hypothetical protein [Rubricoccaceae bacterium]
MSTPFLSAPTALPPRLQGLLQTMQERKARTHADRELARRILFAVENAPLDDLRGLSIYVHDGSVAVYGQIPFEALRERVLGLVVEQPGVRRLQDHLQCREA